MAALFQITINRVEGPTGSMVTFDDSQLNDVRAGDQIFWTNNDSEPHWPSRIVTNEDPSKTIAMDQTSFMENQIAAGGSSATFAPGVAETIDYVCSLHLKCGVNGLSSEAGKIVVNPDPA